MIVSSINVLVEAFVRVGGFGGRSYTYERESILFQVNHKDMQENKSV